MVKPDPGKVVKLQAAADMFQRILYGMNPHLVVYMSKGCLSDEEAAAIVRVVECWAAEDDARERVKDGDFDS
jgi:hypothetical protein